MLSKALFIDFKKHDIPPTYLKRLKRLLSSTTFLSRDDNRLASELKDTQLILAKISTKIDKDIIDASPKLKYVGVLSTAFDAIDVKYAGQKKIAVCNLGGYSTEAVAEFFLAALLEHFRELEKAKVQARQEDYSFDKFMGTEVKGKVLGVIGAGKIGSRIAELGLGIGMKVLYSSRKSKPQIEKLGAKKKLMDYILTESDVIVIALALNKETTGIIDKNKLNLIKPGAVLVSLCPPPLLDQEAIMQKANKGSLTYIFDHSDDMESELVRRFLKTKNVIVYPAIAFRTEQANTTRWETFVSNIENFLKGSPTNKVS